MNFLEMCKGKSVEELYALPDLEGHLASLTSELKTYDEHSRENALLILAKLAAFNAQNITVLKNEMAAGKDKIARVQRNSEACIAYIKGQKT